MNFDEHTSLVKKYVTTKLYIILLLCLTLYYLIRGMYEVSFMLAVLLLLFMQIRHNLKKDLFIQEEEEEEEQEDIEEEQDWGSDNNTDFGDDNLANNALQYASIVSTPSNTAGSFKHIPKESRYAFYEKDEVRDVKHWDKVYRNYTYMKKVLKLQAQEDIHILNNRMKLYKVNDIKSFETYCKVNNNLISFNSIKHNKELLDEVVEHIQTLKESGFYEDIKNQNQNVTGFYDTFRKSTRTPKYIDDLGMTGNILASSVISMGRAGNERQAQITTISATRDIDIKKEQEQKTDYRNKIGSFINKFT